MPHCKVPWKAAGEARSPSHDKESEVTTCDFPQTTDVCSLHASRPLIFLAAANARCLRSLQLLVPSSSGQHSTAHKILFTPPHLAIEREGTLHGIVPSVTHAHRSCLNY
jgi:hypothetical protein